MYQNQNNPNQQQNTGAQQNQQSKPKQGCKRNPLKKQNSFPVNGYWKKN